MLEECPWPQNKRALWNQEGYPGVLGGAGSPVYRVFLWGCQVSTLCTIYWTHSGHRQWDRLEEALSVRCREDSVCVQDRRRGLLAVSGHGGGLGAFRFKVVWGRVLNLATKGSDSLDFSRSGSDAGGTVCPPSASSPPSPLFTLPASSPLAFFCPV